MTYLKRTSRPRQGAGKIALAAVGLALIFAVNFAFPRFFPSIFYPLTSGLLKGESTSVGFFVTMGEIVQSKYSLVKQNKALEDEVAARDRSILMLDTLQAENESLKQALGRTGKGSYVLGVILTRPPVSPYDTLVVDAGSDQGVKVGNRVYAEGDVLVGDVQAVFGNQSMVSLFSTPGRVTDVLVGTSTISATATGQGGGNFTMTLPADTKVAPGVVVTVSQIHPETFGVVGSATTDSSGSLQTVLFRSPVNVSQLGFVEIDRSSYVASSSPKKF